MSIKIHCREFGSSSLSDLGNRSEHGGRVRPDFPDIEAHSESYATINREIRAGSGYLLNRAELFCNRKVRASAFKLKGGGNEQDKT